MLFKRQRIQDCTSGEKKKKTKCQKILTNNSKKLETKSTNNGNTFQRRSKP